MHTGPSTSLIVRFLHIYYCLYVSQQKSHKSRRACCRVGAMAATATMTRHWHCSFDVIQTIKQNNERKKEKKMERKNHTAPRQNVITMAYYAWENAFPDFNRNGGRNAA